jgi:ubiquinone/menaquinone biosynthesis C-methylase UbiE
LYYKGEKYQPNHPKTDFHGQGEAIRKELASRIHPSKGMRVLDIGTGFGRNLESLATLLRGEGKIWTLDPSNEVLENAEKAMREKQLDKNITFVNGTAENLPFEDNFFDLVISLMVLHHLPKVEAATKEIVRTLKNGGVVILSDWGKEAHELQFASRHEEKDFLDPQLVESLLKMENVSNVAISKFSNWYIVEAVK